MADKKIIFHIDDEPEMHLLVQMILGKQGYQMVTAVSGPEGIEKLKDFTPDLIILDIAMPLMDGWKVRKEMMEFEHLKDVPVVFLTAKLGSGDALQGLHGIEADAYLTKPFNPNELIDTVGKILADNN